MSEATPESEPMQTMDQLVNMVFSDPDTITSRNTGFKLLGTGTEEWSRSLKLQGWDELIAPQYHYAGCLVLYHTRTAKYTLGKRRTATDRYTLGFSYAKDSEGRISATLFVYDIPLRQPATSEDHASQLLQAHLRWREQQ
ncbi:MAG TPA: hypothetical protein VJ836_01685 [Candidatus Saccharimonadales bacterium]|nr:hypothetical protein [Candidatus Saccharimonadales bacterium]